MADEHRMWTRGDRLRRFDDPTQSDDPRVVAVLEQLDTVARQQATVVAPAEFRTELRAQLVAIAPRIIAEYTPVAASTKLHVERAALGADAADRPRPSPRPKVEQPPAREDRPHRRSFRDVLGRIPIGRPLAVVASLVTVLTLVLGGSVYLSRDAVPGDTLYGLKRASERFELSLADTDTDRAGKYLEFASNRVIEARELVSRASASAAGRGPLADGAVSAQTARLVTDALNSADGDTQTASRLLGGAAVDSASPAPLTTLTDWAPTQLRRLEDLRAAVPAGTPVKAAAAQSAAMLQKARNRAESLQRRVDCKCLQNAPTDAYGPLPASNPSAISPSTRSDSPTASKAPAGGTRTQPGTPRKQTTAPATGGATNGRSTAPRLPKVPLPSVGIPTPKITTSGPPLSGLCKVNLLGLRFCPSPSS